jgi:hypothetical protein
MKTFVTRMILLTAVAAAPLLATQAAYAQRHREAPQWSGAAERYQAPNYRSQSDQQIIDEITRNDESAGK